MLYQDKADRLRERLTCTEFRKIVECVEQKVTGKDLFCNGFNWLREALILCEYAEYVNADYVCLTPRSNRGSDGIIWIDERKIEVEITMAKNTNRDICGEYLSEDQSPIHMDCDDDSRAIELNDLRNSIHERVSKKMSKTEHLLILYINHHSLLVANRDQAIHVAIESVREIEQRRSDVVLRISEEWIMIPKP